MRWIFITVVVLLIVLSPKFRKLGLILGAAVIAAIVIIIIGNSQNKPTPAPATADTNSPPATKARLPDPDDYRIEQQDKVDPEAKTRIPLGSVRLVQIEPNFTLPSGSMQSIYARLYNDSQRFTLTDYAYYLTVQDCGTGKSPGPSPDQCTTVYDQRARRIPLVVPPNQARDITINIPTDAVTQAPPFKILGKARIELAVTETRAYRSTETPQPAADGHVDGATAVH
jgi:hypothetical protein